MKESAPFQLSESSHIPPTEKVTEDALRAYHNEGGVLFESVNPETGILERKHFGTNQEQIIAQFQRIVQDIPAFRDNPLNHPPKE